MKQKTIDWVVLDENGSIWIAPTGRKYWTSRTSATLAWRRHNDYASWNVAKDAGFSVKDYSKMTPVIPKKLNYDSTEHMGSRGVVNAEHVILTPSGKIWKNPNTGKNVFKSNVAAKISWVRTNKAPFAQGAEAKGWKCILRSEYKETPPGFFSKCVGWLTGNHAR